MTSSIIKTQEQNNKKTHPQPLNQSSFMSKWFHKTNNLFHSPIQSLLHKSVSFVLIFFVRFFICEQNHGKVADIQNKKKSLDFSSIQAETIIQKVLLLNRTLMSILLGIEYKRSINFSFMK